MPVLFGVLTCESMEQAIHRAGGNVGNKGAECAEAALAWSGLLKKLAGCAPSPLDDRGLNAVDTFASLSAACNVARRIP